MEANEGPRVAQCWASPLNFGIWIRDDGWLPYSGAYRINITIRFKVRRREKFVEPKEPPKRFKGWVYPKKAGILSIDFSLSKFSLDRRIIGCASTAAYQITNIFQ